MSVPASVLNSVPAAYRATFGQAVAQYAPPGVNTTDYADALAKVIGHESSWNPNATGYNTDSVHSIDRGIAQINSYWHPDVTNAQAYNPDFAIPWAASFLSQKIQQSGSVQAGVAAYNPGDPNYAHQVLGGSAVSPGSASGLSTGNIGLAGLLGGAFDYAFVPGQGNTFGPIGTALSSPGAALADWGWIVLLGIGLVVLVVATLRIL